MPFSFNNSIPDNSLEENDIIIYDFNAQKQFLNKRVLKETLNKQKWDFIILFVEKFLTINDFKALFYLFVKFFVGFNCIFYGRVQVGVN